MYNVRRLRIVEKQNIKIANKKYEKIGVGGFENVLLYTHSIYSLRLTFNHKIFNTKHHHHTTIQKAFYSQTRDYNIGEYKVHDPTRLDRTLYLLR